MVFRKRLNSPAHGRERGFKRFSRKVQPRQPQVICVAKLGSLQAAGVERIQEFVIRQMRCGKLKRHKPIMPE